MYTCMGGGTSRPAEGCMYGEPVTQGKWPCNGNLLREKGGGMYWVYERGQVHVRMGNLLPGGRGRVCMGNRFAKGKG